MTKPVDDPLRAKIERVKISGFRSLANVDVPLSDLSVIIGPNGAGKSNFIRFFDMLSWMLLSQKLGNFIEEQGGADDQLFGGNKRTPRLGAEIHLRTNKGRNDYMFSLAYANPDRFFFSEEAFRFSRDDLPSQASWVQLEGGHREASIVDFAKSSDQPIYNNNKTTAWLVVNFLRNCKVFQFHDTSHGSKLKMTWDVEDTAKLRGDGGNLAAILNFLKQNEIKHYTLICQQIKRVLPQFMDFELEARYGKIALRWLSDHLPDKSIGAHLTSDGSLRLFALITLLNLPSEMLPDVVLLDEPELGLHPAAIALIGRMIRSLSTRKQVIVATQSPLLVDSFNLDEIIVTECHQAKTVFRPLKAEDYQHWLDDNFKPGELWLKNVIGGRP